RLGHRLVEVLADRLALGHGPAVELDDRDLARRIAAQEFRPLFPVALLHQFHLDPLLGKRQPYLAAEGRERDVEETGHAESSCRGCGPVIPAAPLAINPR